jgi:thiol-disulfide isomerase/thioredoxin
MEDSLMQTVVKFFTSNHCAFCRSAKTILEGLKQSFGEGIRIEEVNIDENPRVAIEEGILALPVVIIGSWKFVGVPDKDDAMTAILNAFGGEMITGQGGKEIFQEGRQ